MKRSMLDISYGKPYDGEKSLVPCSGMLLSLDDIIWCRNHRGHDSVPVSDTLHHSSISPFWRPVKPDRSGHTRLACTTLKRFSLVSGATSSIADGTFVRWLAVSPRSEQDFPSPDTL